MIEFSSEESPETKKFWIDFRQKLIVENYQEIEIPINSIVSEMSTSYNVSEFLNFNEISPIKNFSHQKNLFASQNLMNNSDTEVNISSDLVQQKQQQKIENLIREKKNFVRDINFSESDDDDEDDDEDHDEDEYSGTEEYGDSEEQEKQENKENLNLNVQNVISGLKNEISSLREQISKYENQLDEKETNFLKIFNEISSKFQNRESFLKSVSQRISLDQQLLNNEKVLFEKHVLLNLQNSPVDSHSGPNFSVFEKYPLQFPNSDLSFQDQVKKNFLKNFFTFFFF